MAARSEVCLGLLLHVILFLAAIQMFSGKFFPACLLVCFPSPLYVLVMSNMHSTSLLEGLGWYQSDHILSCNNSYYNHIFTHALKLCYDVNTCQQEYFMVYQVGGEKLV